MRNQPPFLRFLGIAGLLNGQAVNGQDIARDASVPRSTVDVYFSILEDTLLGHFLPAYRPKVKIREQARSKFYWFDPGVARAAAGLLRDPLERAWAGNALEALVFHELRVFNHTQNKERPIAYYRTGSGAEIDFVVETKNRQGVSPPHVVCIEVKLSKKWERKWEQPMRSLRGHDDIVVEKMFGVYTGERGYHFDGLDVLPVLEFLKRLHEGEVY
ncbi:MAG: DUF4143 domain-containing protein [Planctomycetes bacterium]|nr:DUF4143 domain-containing protein [Planctomycetota bacterium]